MTVVDIKTTLLTTWARCRLSTEFRYFHVQAKYKIYINYTTVVNITMTPHTRHLKYMHKQGSHDITMTRHTRHLKCMYKQGSHDITMTQHTRHLKCMQKQCNHDITLTRHTS